MYNLRPLQPMSGGEATLVSLENIGTPDYQRTLSESKVKYYQGHFNPNHVGFLVINQRPDGSLWVVDGQHRLEAMRRLHITAAMCELFHYETIVDEAAAYVARNAHRAMPLAGDRWVARRAMGDPIVLDIDAALAAEGLELGVVKGRNSRTKVPSNLVSAYKAVEDIYTHGGLDLLKLTLVTICLGCPPKDSNVARFTQAFLVGMARFLVVACREGYDPKRLTYKLQSTSVQTLLDDAVSYVRLQQGDRPHAVALQLVSLYNKNLQTKRLPAEAFIGKHRDKSSL